MFVKLPRGGGRWTIVEAIQVDTDGVRYQLPVPPEPKPGEVVGMDVAANLREREVELRQNVCVLDVSQAFSPKAAWYDPCVKVVHVLDTANEEWWTYIFQGDGYVMGDSGGTIDKI